MLFNHLKLSQFIIYCSNNWWSGNFVKFESLNLKCETQLCNVLINILEKIEKISDDTMFLRTIIISKNRALKKEKNMFEITLHTLKKNHINKYYENIYFFPNEKYS